MEGWGDGGRGDGETEETYKRHAQPCLRLLGQNLHSHSSG